MRIVYVHQYFKTPSEGGAVRSYHLAKGLVDAGHAVEMITGGATTGYDRRWIDGIIVHYLPVHYDQKFGFLKRSIAFLEFVSQAKTLITKLPKPDLLYVTSTPLTTGLIGIWTKKKYAVPYLFEVRDIWPQAPIEVGAIKNPLLIWILQLLEKKIYTQAIQLVSLSPGIVAHLRKVAPRQSVHLIPNFSDLQLFFPKAKNQTTLKKYGLKSALTIGYTGALGKINAVDELLTLAELAKNRGKNWQFLIMGEGSHQAYLQETALKKSLSGICFIPFGPKEKVNEVLGLSDFAWVSFAHLPVLKTNSPNKFFDALAAGKAIIVNHKGWVYDLVETYQLGIACLPSNVEEAFAKLEEVDQNRDELAAMGQNSRKLAEQRFSKETAISQLNQLVDSLVFFRPVNLCGFQNLEGFNPDSWK